MKRISKLFLYRKKIIRPYVDNIVSFTNGTSYFMSLIVVLTMIFEHGFRVSYDAHTMIGLIYNCVWITYLTNTLAQLILKFSDTIAKYKKFTWIITILLLLTLVPVIFTEPIDKSSILHQLWSIFDNRWYKTVLFVVISFMQLSNGIVLLLGRRINPSFIFSVSFLIIIFIGAGMLMLPRASYNGISFIDALFMSTSATCVTGLTTVDVVTTFTPMGRMFLMILIQIGGVGVMTLTSFLAVFFMENASLYNQSMMCDMVSSKSLNSLLSTLLYILGFTLIIEGIGALFIFISIHGTLDMTLQREIYFSIFHSISAFCNAGFAIVPDNLGYAPLMVDHNLFFFVISMLIVFGGISFPILVNLAETVVYRIKKYRERLFGGGRDKLNRVVHLLDINTKIVLIMTLILIVVGTVTIAIFEWNHAFYGMSVLDKCVQSFFNAVSPRTAGFSSVPVSSFSLQTILLILALMVIGGGAQSTAGGIKVNVFAIIMINMRAIIYGAKRVRVFNRELPFDTIRRANSTLLLYLIFAFMGIFVITIFEPEASLLEITFECISALSTVGASLGITPSLGVDSKVAVIVLMFVGRIGVLTMVSSLIKQKKNRDYRYPSGNIITN